MASNLVLAAATMPSIFNRAAEDLIEHLKQASETADVNEISTSDLVKRLEKSVHNVCGLASTIKVITAVQLKEKMQSNPNLCVMNVLGKRYYDDCRINCKNPKNAPLKQLVNTVDSWDRSTEIVVYCALDECDASEKACVLLRCMGFENIYEYKGGIKEWFQKRNQKEYATAGPCSCEYLHETDNKHEPESCEEARNFDMKLALNVVTIPL